MESTGGRRFGQVVVGHRERLGLTQEALATMTGLSARRISELESGRVERPRMATVRLLAEAFGLSGASREEFCQQAYRSADPPVATTPAQLPADLPMFAGRDDEIAELDAMLDRASGVVPRLAVSVICGTPGVGKTALAVHWAHRVRSRFPDGQLYVNLRGYAQTPPRSTLEAVADFLSDLGVPAEQIPTGVDRATGMYRSLLADRRTLIVLDNARDPDQVRALVPGGSGCMVVVTSRDRLTGLAMDGARHLSLDVLTPNNAHALLANILGTDRAADPDIAELASACAYLPLALRIAVANLHAGARRPISAYLAELASDRLGRLAVPGDQQAAVRDAFALSYEALGPAAQRAFALLSLIQGSDWTVEAVAALLGADRSTAVDTVDQLAAAHLVEEYHVGRYSHHDLLSEYAASALRTRMSTEEADAARARLLDFYLRSSDRVAQLCYPHDLRLGRDEPRDLVEPMAFDAPRTALAWIDAELDNLVAETVATAESGPRQLSWQFVDSLRGYFWLRRPAVHWLSAVGAALSASRLAADQEAEAAMGNMLGTAHWTLGNHPEAVLAYQEALEVNRSLGRQVGEAGVLGNLAGVYREMGRLDESEQCGRQALALQCAVGNVRGKGNVLLNLAGLALDTGQLQQAVDLAREALDNYHLLDNPNPDAIGAALLQVGEALLAVHQVAEATVVLRQAADIFSGIEAVAGEAGALILLAEADYQLGRTDAGLSHAARALQLARDIDNAPLEAGAAVASGNGHARRGDFDTAGVCYETALGLVRASQTPHGTIDALLGLAAVDRQRDQPDLAMGLAHEALAAARAGGLLRHESRALELLATMPSTIRASSGSEGTLV